MSGQPIDTNCMTLTRFVLAEQRKYPTASGNLSQLLASIQSAVKAISAAVRRAGIAKLSGAVGDTNVQGEEQQKLDVLSNELFINLLRFVCFLLVLNGTVEFGDKELFGHPKIVPYRQKFLILMK